MVGFAPPFCILHSTFCIRLGVASGGFACPFCILHSSFCILHSAFASRWLWGRNRFPSTAASQSLTHPLPHPVPELAWSEHLDMRHPGENPARQFLATGGLQAELQRAVPTLPQCLAPVPDPLSDVGGDLAREEQAHLPGFVRLADAEGALEETPGIEVSRPREALPSPLDRAEFTSEAGME